MADTPDHPRELGHHRQPALNRGTTAIREDGQRFAFGPPPAPPMAYLGSNLNEGSLPDVSYLHGLLPPPQGRSSPMIRRYIPLELSPYSTEVPVPNAVRNAVTIPADSYSPDSEFHTMRCQTLCP